MSRPPLKRPRGLDLVLDPDPFDEDFTQDDLDEIDVIASQAITTATAEEAGLGKVSTAMAASRPALPKRHIDDMNSSSANGVRAAQSSSQHLEAQHARLKRKLAEVEKDIVLKSGEIRVLRDSLRAAQQETETQRLKQVQIQTQRQREHDARERDLLKKVQSLESQLQFKEGEINDMRSKLLTDRRSSPLCRHSPKAQSSTSPSGGFITKGSFNAQVKTTPLSSANETAVRTPSKCRPQEVMRADPFLSVRGQKSLSPGGVLLGLLLRPLSQRLGLCHLSSNSSLTGGGGDVLKVTGTAASPAQSLALTGLNMMSLSQHQNSCPGAVLLLPLLSSDLMPLCRPSGHAGAEKREEPQSGLTSEERGIVALKTLTALLHHSPEVVKAVLSDQSLTRTPPTEASNSASQNALLSFLLKLVAATQTDVSCAVLTTLRVLVQRTPETLQDRLHCVVSEVSSCAVSALRVKVMTLCVSVLTSVTDHKDLPICCHEPCVVLRLLQFSRNRPDPEASPGDWVQLDFRVVRFLSRILTQSSVRFTNTSCPCYSELVQCVVLILHRLWLGLKQTPPAHVEAPPSSRPRGGSVLGALREAVLLFHWLQQNHSGFTESCGGVLHLYDQVIPALRDGLRGTSYCHELAMEEICRSEPDDDMETDSGS